MKHPRNLYAAFLSTMDERIGRLLEKVDSLGLRERTIVIVQSDHGHSTEERAFWGGGSAGIHRGAKFSLFEGGIRVPAIISWPGQLPENQVRSQAAYGCDWLPTIAELCGADAACRHARRQEPGGAAQGRKGAVAAPGAALGDRQELGRSGG